jgi:predicted nucleic acid-binding protein
MRIYLDCCSIQRPFDDQTQPRIKVEAEAVLAILGSVQAGELSLLDSEALQYEIGRIPDDGRRGEVTAILAVANEYIEITEEVEAFSKVLEVRGLRAIDAIHLAIASVAGADYFSTCDDKLLRASKSISDVKCRVISVLDLVAEVLR